MASESGTATNLEDLVTKILTFLTTDADLVAADQEWDVLRSQRNNLSSVLTNLTEQTNVLYIKIRQTARYDPRSLQCKSTSGSTGSCLCTGYVAGTSYVTYILATTKTVTTVRMRAPDATYLAYMIKNFRLQYSDDGSAWTTALTVSSSPTYGAGEEKDFSVGGSPGSHVYWKIIIDSGGSGSNIAWDSLVLLNGTEVVNQFGSEAILKCRGLAGTDLIYTGLRTEWNDSVGWYNIFLNGFTGYDSNDRKFWTQPGAIPGAEVATPLASPIIPCWNSSMPYWIAASGRAMRIVVKVSTSYESGGMGWILPYATPGQYPYPLLVFGSLVGIDTRGTTWRYSEETGYHSGLPVPACSAVNAPVYSSMYIRLPDGSWGPAGNRDGATQFGTLIVNYPELTVGGTVRSLWPMSAYTASGGRRMEYRECLGGGYLLQPFVLHQRTPYPAAWGEIEGLFKISGFSNAAENTGTYGGDPFTVFQNAFRSEVQEYFAMRMD
jgi:hypothetical protein